jgi:hypothetical protein
MEDIFRRLAHMKNQHIFIIFSFNHINISLLFTKNVFLALLFHII